MNNNENSEFPEALRWQLRGLRQDVAPGRDLWPGIAERLAAQPAVAPRRRAPWLAPMAMAASVLLVVGTLGWFGRAPGPAPSAPTATLVQIEAEGLTRQYQAALQEMAAAPVPESLQPTVEALDRDVALIREALAHDPDSVLLLEQLRRTYARRLALAQRAAYA